MSNNRERVSFTLGSKKGSSALANIPITLSAASEKSDEKGSKSNASSDRKDTKMSPQKAAYRTQPALATNTSESRRSPHSSPRRRQDQDDRRSFRNPKRRSPSPPLRRTRRSRSPMGYSSPDSPRRYRSRSPRYSDRRRRDYNRSPYSSTTPPRRRSRSPRRRSRSPAYTRRRSRSPRRNTDRSRSPPRPRSRSPPRRHSNKGPTRSTASGNDLTVFQQHQRRQEHRGPRHPSRQDNSKRNGRESSLQQRQRPDSKQPSTSNSRSDQLKTEKSSPRRLPPENGEPVAASKAKPKPKPAFVFPEWIKGLKDQFEIERQVGEGTFGQVYKAKFAQEHLVALKKIRTEHEREGFPITALREIKLLRHLRHANIVNLLGIVTESANNLEVVRRGNHQNPFYMVLEYMDYDLTGLLSSDVNLSQHAIQWFSKQLLEGLRYCHKNDILHRDLKGSNLLLNHRGDLKLADFGLARIFHKDEERGYTNRVITLWYRPPELLLGATRYGPEVDVWSAGCILGEFFLKRPIFRAENEIDQLDTICKVCGIPLPTIWPNVQELPLYSSMRPRNHYSRSVKSFFANYNVPEVAIGLLDKFLVLDPKRRITIDDALKHPFVAGVARPADLRLPQKDLHEFETKKKKRLAQQLAQQQAQQSKP